jgi:peroxiredoxin
LLGLFDRRDSLGELLPRIFTGMQQGLMHQSWELWERLSPLLRFFPKASAKGCQTDLIPHPALKKGLGGFPEVEIGVELTAKTFYVEQGFLEQRELGLNLYVKAAGRLKQPNQNLT